MDRQLPCYRLGMRHSIVRDDNWRLYTSVISCLLTFPWGHVTNWMKVEILKLEKVWHGKRRGLARKGFIAGASAQRRAVEKILGRGAQTEGCHRPLRRVVASQGVISSSSQPGEKVGGLPSECSCKMWPENGRVLCLLPSCPLLSDRSEAKHGKTRGRFRAGATAQQKVVLAMSSDRHLPSSAFSRWDQPRSCCDHLCAARAGWSKNDRLCACLLPCLYSGSSLGK